MTRFTFEILVDEQDAHATRRAIKEVARRYAVNPVDYGSGESFSWDYSVDNHVETIELVKL